MKAWIGIVFHTIKVFVLFTGCTILFYYGIMWINEEYQNYHRYDAPEGAAVKVSTSYSNEEASWLDRLILFYWIGE
ncbi:YqzK family protein [Mesobacillus harenae]|uniref:YqzK family protein n=1 Tax=Mesobacillus harenae TaxID=2213203 RepID=UPI00158093EA|nr:YqzK family protein [Mesobacillus harenae]